jgi:hypothetical protein
MSPGSTWLGHSPYTPSNDVADSSIKGSRCVVSCTSVSVRISAMALSISRWAALICLTLFSQLVYSAPIDKKGILSLLLDLLTKKNDNACVSLHGMLPNAWAGVCVHCVTPGVGWYSELLPSTVSDIKTDCTQCTALDHFLPGKVAFATNLTYTTSQITFWSAQEQSLHPSCIVIPTSTQDVSTAVTVLNVGYQAAIPGCKFAVRGAG